MKLTALEIKQQKFEKSLRGYDTAEVQAFLNLMSNEWEHMVGKNRELQKKIDELQEKLKHYERVEEALHETLQAAKESAETKLDGARREAENKIEKAEMQAESIVREAKQERQQVRQSIKRLLDRRKEIIGGIRSYLEVAQESVEEFEQDKARRFEEPGAEPELTEEAGADVTGTVTDQGGPGGNTGGEDETKKTSATPSAANAPITPPGTEDIDDLVDDLE